MEECAAFDIKANTTSFFKANPTPPTPAKPTAQFYAVPCDPADTNQAVTLKGGQLITANGLCADVACDAKTKTAKSHAPLALTKCDPTNLGQQWTHTAEATFVSACGGMCIDLFGGGNSDEAGIYQCTPNIWNQKWVRFGKT